MPQRGSEQQSRRSASSSPMVGWASCGLAGHWPCLLRGEMEKRLPDAAGQTPKTAREAQVFVG